VIFNGGVTISVVMRGLDPRIYLAKKDGLPGQARQ